VLGVEVGLPLPSEAPGVGVGLTDVPPLSDGVPSSVGTDDTFGADEEPVVESAGLGSSSPDFEDDVSCPVTAALTVALAAAEAVATALPAT
jgi:hypothetical protein